MRIDIEMNH